MGKKSKKKGGATNKAARKEKLQERREQQLEEVDNKKINMNPYLDAITDQQIQNILLYGCTDDVATTRGVNTSPAVAITQPDTSRGDNNTRYMSTETDADIDNNIGQLKRPPEQLIEEERDDAEQLRLAIELSMQEDYKDSDMCSKNHYC